MDKIKDLMLKLCPNGMEYTDIRHLINSKVIVIVTPSIKIKRNDYKRSGIIPIVSQEEELISGYCDIVDKNIPLNNYVCFGDHSEHIKYIDFSFVQGADGLKILKTDENNILVKYLYYTICNFYQRRNNYERHFKYLLDTYIPVPPMPVQIEIVRVLDNFIKLIAELLAELTARKRQYEYYRDRLLEFDISIPKVKLQDIATDIYRGSGITREQITEGGIPCVRYGEIYTTYNIWFDECKSRTRLENIESPKYFEYGDILFAITGESVEDIAKSTAYVGNDKCLAGGDIVVLKHKQNPKYLSYALSTYNAQKQKSKGKIKSKVVHSSLPDIGSIEIPLPDLEIQNKIVDVLDNFESICNDVNIGLPAEIEARRKQYEYYRDKLLSFPEW